MTYDVPSNTPNSAIEALHETSSKVEYSSALMTKGIALTMLGELDRARTDLDHASTLGQTEAALERADIDDSFGDPTGTKARLEVFEPDSINGNDRIALSLQWARYHSRRGNHELARTQMDEIPSEIVGLYPGQSTEHLVTRAYVAVASGSQDGPAAALEAHRAAKKQGAHRWRQVAEVLSAVGQDQASFSSAIARVGEASPWNLTYLADILVHKLDVLNEDGLAGVASAAALHPRRCGTFFERSSVRAEPAKDSVQPACLRRLASDGHPVAKEVRAESAQDDRCFHARKGPFAEAGDTCFRGGPEPRSNPRR